MSDLIVDFPRERDSKVYFSVMSDLWVYECEIDAKDKSKTWYSENEYKQMKQDIKRSIRRKYVSSLFPSNQAGIPSSQAGTAFSANEELLDKDGHEDEFEDEIALLDPNVIRWVQSHKISHRMAVLTEQERQDRSGERSPSKIAYVSQLYSQWSTIRAQRTMRLG